MSAQPKPPLDSSLEQLPRHIKTTARGSLFLYERCECNCVVSVAGLATGCGAIACPSCGTGGANVARSEEPPSLDRVGVPPVAAYTCSCGAAWSSGVVRGNPLYAASSS